MSTMTTEEELYAERAALRCLRRAHPEWTQGELALHLGRSLSWVKKWLRRLRTAPPDDVQILWSQSRAHHTPYPRWDDGVVERILEIRDQPPEGLRRVPGPRAILYYLWRDPTLREQGAALPRSTGAIWRLLARNGRIVRTRRPEHEPVERPVPMTSWQLDFKDASTVAVEPEGKRGHAVEVLNTLDVGTSVLLGADVRADYSAETSLRAVAALVRVQGVPDHITFDRDPRFVGSATARDFPAPCVRFWACLGVDVTICPPQRPDKNAFVERYHRSYNQECLQVERPRTVAEVREVTAVYTEHYTYERPNQARSCGNRPPRVAFPALPARPSIPLVVDPDAWLRMIDGHAYVRRVQSDGDVVVGDVRYDVGRDLVKQQVAVQADARAREFIIVYAGMERGRVPIKGLVQRLLSFDDFIDLLAKQARRSWGTTLPAAG